LNERFVSNITGDIIFSTNYASDSPTTAETKNFSLKKNIIKREQRAIETLMSHYLAKEKSILLFE